SAVKSLTPVKAGEKLQEGVVKALNSKHNIEPLTPPEKHKLTIEYNNHDQAECDHLMPGTYKTHGTTKVSFQPKDMLEAYQAMLVMTELAMNTKFSRISGYDAFTK